MRVREQLKREYQLRDYRPYTKQREFHAAGKLYRERLLMAANQTGKTWAGGAEVAIHMTGEYPNWWPGRLWNKPVVGWVAGVTSELTRDGPQRILMGRAHQIGQGAIPKARIVDYSMKRGVADAIDTVVVRCGGGGDIQPGDSILTFKSYDQGREKFQAETLDLIWFDEEPDYDIYTEGLTRTNASGGFSAMTFTPLKGMSQTVMRFITEKDRYPGTHVTTMTIDEAEHYTDEQRKVIIESYPDHEKVARAQGIPVLGSGRIFPLSDETVAYSSIATLPPHWKRIAAIDFGHDHPTAIVWGALDADTDTLYLYDCYRVSRAEGKVPEHAAALRARGLWIPVAWPHDGLNDTAAGPQLAKQYRDQGILMLPEHAQYPIVPGEQGENVKRARSSVEAGLQDMLTRMQTGRLKVAAHLADWFEEFRLYHRKDGKIVKLRDDLMSATRYLCMSLQYAVPPNADTGMRIDHKRRSNWRV